MAIKSTPGANQIVDAVLYGLKSDGTPLILKVTDNGNLIVESSSTDPSLVQLQTANAHLSDLANDKSSEDVGTQQTGVGGAAGGASDVFLAVVDLQDASYHDIDLEVKIQQPVPSNESTKNFTLYWAFISESLATPSEAPTVLSTMEQSMICGLVNATGGATTRYYQTDLIIPRARYLYVWYDCDQVAIQLYLSNIVGTFQTGETVTGGTSGATATVNAVNADNLVVSMTSGTFQVGETITGGTSGATATISSIVGGLTVDVRLNKLS